MKIKLNTHYTKTLADIHTPVGIYLKLRDKYLGTIMLESSEYQSIENSYSFICCNPISSIKATKKTIEVQYPKQDLQVTDNGKNQLSTELSKFTKNFESEDLDLPFFHNGVFGFSTYDTIGFEEDLSLQQETGANKDIPLLHYAVYRYIFVFNHYNNELHLIENTLEGQESDFTITDLLNNTANQYFSFKTENEERSNFTDKEYEDVVLKGQEHCKRGDVFQLVISREFQQSFKGDDFNVYRALRMINPSPYLFLFDYGSFKLFGSSPEAQLRIKDKVAEIHPIAGTYKRTGYKDKDAVLAEQLLNDPKETAEHTMLVDLARNDLSRNSKKVVIEKLNQIQYYSHVIHMVSKVTGTLENEDDNIKVFFDTFPAGTLSGAPKHKAMTLIDKYEKGARSYYGGAIGYIGFNGEMNQAIMIRTILSKDNTLTYQAGAGIVINSDPKSEREEVNNKIGALRKAIKLAEEL
jgi:anthranilate synthase component 1